MRRGLQGYEMKSEIENCFKAIVVSKHKECKNKIRKYYYGKKYYYVTVVNSKGEEIEKVRILKKTFENIKKGDKVICFDYRRPSLLLGEKAAIKDLNDIDNKKEVN